MGDSVFIEEDEDFDDSKFWNIFFNLELDSCTLAYSVDDGATCGIKILSNYEYYPETVTISNLPIRDMLFVFKTYNDIKAKWTESIDRASIGDDMKNYLKDFFGDKAIHQEERYVKIEES